MKISIITITCRENPRLVEAGRTIAASLDRCPDVELEWLIVDEKARSLFDLLGLTPHDLPTAELVRERAAVYARVDGRLLIEVIPTPPTPHRSGTDKAVAHNTARNAGLAKATGDYVVLLNDCNIVTMDWATVARDCATQGMGWRCKMDSVSDMAVPVDGIVKYKSHHDLLHVVPPMTVAGACYGAPVEALEEIHGFDLAYDGQRKFNDVDAIIRMSRLGLKFVTTERAFTLQLRRTKIDHEVTTRKDVYVGARNQATFNQLLRDKDRILPLVEDPRLAPRTRLVVEGADLKADGVASPVSSDARNGNYASSIAHLITQPELNDGDPLLSELDD